MEKQREFRQKFAQEKLRYCRQRIHEKFNFRQMIVKEHDLE